MKRNNIIELIKTLYNLLKLNRDVNTEIMNKALSQRESEKLSDLSQRTINYKSQTRYVRYQVQRIIRSIKTGNIKKALTILLLLIKHSQSYSDILVQKVKKSVWNSIKKKYVEVIDSILSKLETVALIVIVFIIANVRKTIPPILETIPPILETESTNYSWYLTGIIILGVVVITVCISQKYYNPIKETSLDSINGPLTQLQYENIQQELANQALIDNLAISPIGDLWIMPF